MAITGSSFTGLILVLLVTLPDSTGACPRPCACYAPGEVHCTFRSLVTVPAGISTRAQRVNLGFNAINHIPALAFGGLRRLELLMMHGNNLQKIPDGAFQDLVSLQILKMSYNKLSVITGHSFSGLTGLIRLHLDHNLIEFIHPDAFSGMTSLRLLHLEGNHLQKLHPATFSTFSLLQRFHISTLKHLYLSDNLLSTLPKEMMGNLPQLENIFLYGNPWSCDCRMSWLQDWRSSGVVKCKKDRTFADGQLCPRCSSPKQLMGKDISDVKEFICTGPAISSSGKDILHEENISELLPIDRIKEPFGNVSFSLSDEHGTKADLFCQILEPSDSTKISWNYTNSQQIAANMTLFFDVECSFDRDNYESLWRLLAYYSEVPVRLRREIMLTREPELSYRYKQDIEKDAFYYTGVRANVLARPSWLMQSFMNIKLNRPYSSSKSVRLILNTQVSTVTDEDLIRQQKRPWVMIEHDNKTQTTFSCVVGGMIEMNCVVRSSEDAAVQWMLPDGSRVKVSASTPNDRVTVSSTGKLHIKSVDHSDVGVYYCIAEVVGDVDIVPFRLAVVDSSTPLQGEEIGSALTRFVGESATLPCLSVAAPDAVVNWIFPDGSILNSKANSSTALIYSNGTLFIPYSQLNNNGYHKCLALNQYGVDVLATKLTVLGRKRIQSLQPYPSRPQSAAGVSTRVNVFLEDVEEASGDDSNTQERTQHNRISMNRRRGPNATTHGHSFGRRRRPFRKQNKSDFANQRRANTKSKIDPRKWANILTKIREKSASKNTSFHIVQGNTLVNVESPGLIDNTEGSSPDDSGQHAYNTKVVKVTAHVEEENKNINQTAPSEVDTSADKMTYITTPQSVSNYGITEINVAEERHVGTISGERIENNQIYSGPLIRPPSESEIELNFSKTGALDSGENGSSLLSTTLTSNTGQEAPSGSVQLIARNNLSSRQRAFGSRRRKKLRRPFLKPTISSPRSAYIYPTIPAGDTKVYSTSGTTGPIYPTIPTGDTKVFSTSGTTGPIYPTIPTGDTKVFSTSGTTGPIYPTIPTGDTKVYSTSGTTGPIYPTIPTGDTKVYSTSGTTGPIYPTIPTGDIDVYLTSGTTGPIYPTIPTGDASIYPTTVNTAYIHPTVTTGDTSVYPTSGAHIYSAIPTGDIKVFSTSGTTFPIHPSIPTGDASIYPTTGDTTHIYPTVTLGGTSSYLTSGDTDHIYPTVLRALPGGNSVKNKVDKKEGGKSLYTGERMDKYLTPKEVDPTSSPGTGHVPLTTALQVANSETEATGSSFTLNLGESPMDVLRLSVSHSDGKGENHALSRTSAGENNPLTSVPPQNNSLLHVTHKFNNQSIQNQVSFPLTTEAPTKSISSVATSSHTFVATFIENNDFVISKSVSGVDYREQSVLTHDKPLIVPAASTYSSPITTVPTSATSISITTQHRGTTPSIDLPTASTLSLTNTERSAVQLTPGLPVQDNRIPFHSRNPETNFIVKENGRIPTTNNKYPFYYGRHPSRNIQPNIIRSSSVDIKSIKNIQTTTTAVHSQSTQSKQKIQAEGESVNKKWSEVLSQTHQTLSTLQKRPRITTAKFHTVTVDAGSRLQVPCDSVGDPQPFLSWTKVSTGAIMLSDSRIQRFEVHSNGTFVIHNVQLQDRGQYLCTARNLYGSDRMTVTLVVLAHVPRVTLPRHRDVMVYLGKSVVLECKAQGLPTPNISWVLPDRSVVRTVSGSEQRVMLLANGSLEIKHTNYMDRGVYKCIASNAAGADMLSVRLQISALPPMIHQQRRENRTIPDGQAVYIHCTSEGFPSPALSWVTFNGTQIRPSQFINDNLFVFPNGTLYIRKPTEQDSGNYECVAVNSVGVAMRSVTLHVKGNSSMAKIISTPAQMTDVQYGGQLSLDCTATGTPNPRIIWRTPSKKLLDAHYSFDRRMKVFSNGSLTISPVTEKDEGDYLCVARNKLGDDYLLLRVKVITKAAKIEHKPLNHHKVSYGGELKVDCIASGLPNPEIAWSLPDGTVINSVLQSDDSGVRRKRYVVFDNGTLYFNEVGMKEEGDYTCYAENRIGKDEMKVNIRVVASVPVIHNNTADAIRVPYGKTAVLTCRAEGKPAPAITWMSPVNRVISAVSDKHRVTEDGTLHVHKVQRFDTGNYTCLARNAVGIDRKVIQVEVLVDVPVINGLKDPGTIRRTVMKDHDVLLDCRTEGNPVPQITWVLPNNVVLPAPHYGSRITVHRNGSLEIRAARKSDSAVFLCIARNEGGEAKLQIQLDVTEDIEKPRLRDLPVEHIPLTHGGLVTLNCSVDGRPTPEITWILPNGTSLLRGSGVFRFHHKLDGSLLIREPSVSEAGRYRCVAHNSAGYVERIVMLESSRKPDILNKYNSLVSIVNGENLELNCQASGKPEPELTWTLPSGVILARPQQTGRYAVLSNGTLSVQRASVYDRGIYVCQTNNQHGSSSLTVSVIVIAYPPRITSGPAPVTYAKPGASLQLNCLALATPKAEVIWEMPEGIQFKVGTQPRLYGNKYLHPQGSLIIQNPSKKDNGLYKCTAKNVVGSDSKATYVYVF
ncbi:matrix-remodeling-associated protein 5 [Misgurnus anguillicaudatus]|uniref:matrix-remodeling-associated protein 5 n=1 Tax=Misgurnus anguillicaudatus TaxID=75329 RepID=UPI003CCEFDCD